MGRVTVDLAGPVIRAPQELEALGWEADVVERHDHAGDAAILGTARDGRCPAFVPRATAKGCET